MKLMSNKENLFYVNYHFIDSYQLQMEQERKKCEELEKELLLLRGKSWWNLSSNTVIDRTAWGLCYVHFLSIRCYYQSFLYNIWRFFELEYKHNNKIFVQGTLIGFNNNYY